MPSIQVYLSGLTDTTADHITQQTLNVLQKTDEKLALAGTDRSNLLSATIWLKDVRLCCSREP